ncbi:MAG: hypothetical protein ACXVA9_11480, partial [Bdellovibrionales bacterium]
IDGSSRSGGLAQILSFRSDGSYVIYGDDGARAVGMCGNSACTMSGAPSQYNGEWIEQLAVFKFLGNSLEFHKIYIDGQGQNHTSTVTFTKR